MRYFTKGIDGIEALEEGLGCFMKEQIMREQFRGTSCGSGTRFKQHELPIAGKKFTSNTSCDS